MLKKNIRFLALALSAVCLLSSLLVGCSKTSEKAKQQTSGPSSNSLPIVDKPLTLSFFTAFDSKYSATMKDYNSVACYKEMEKRTGIHINFIIPPMGDETNQFNLMVASGSLPDMINWQWVGSLPGGPMKALSDGTVSSLNSHLAKDAPNLSALMKQDPQFAKEIKADDGTVYCFPWTYNVQTQDFDKKVTKPCFQTFGWQIRQDWLDKLSLKLPETTDDWYNVLTAFKNKDPNGNGKMDEIPLVASKIGDLTPWIRAWGIYYGFYLDGKTVKFGPNEAVYQTALATLAKWYGEGLIDKDFAATDGNQKDAKVTGSLAGSWVGSTSGNLGRYSQTMTAKDPSVHVTGTVPPYITGGKEYKFDTSNSPEWKYQVGTGTAINPKSKHIEEAIKWNDYKYGKEGNLLFNYGIEGQSYTMVNGSPVLTDAITHNPSLSVDQALAQYAMSANMTSMVMDKDIWQQRMYLPVQQEAIPRWGQGDMSRILPPITASSDESAKLSRIMTQVNSYTDEMFVKYVMGQQPMSKSSFDAYLAQLNNLGINDALKIEQAAYERYLKR